MSMHYITNVETDVAGDGDLATVRAMFYNPTQLPGMVGLSYFGGHYFHDLAASLRRRVARRQRRFRGRGCREPYRTPRAP
jgi:hypothetical protein